MIEGLKDDKIIHMIGGRFSPPFLLLCKREHDTPLSASLQRRRTAFIAARNFKLKPVLAIGRQYPSAATRRWLVHANHVTLRTL